MSLINTKKVQGRILLGYCAPLSLLILFAIVMGGTVVMQKSVSEDLERTNHVIDGLNIATLGVSRMVRNAGGAVLFPKESHYTESFVKGVEQFDEGASLVDLHIKDPKQKQLWEDITKESERIEALSNEIFNLLKVGQVQQAIAKTPDLEMTKFNEIYDKMETRQVEIIEGLNQKDARISTISLTKVAAIANQTVLLSEQTTLIGNMKWKKECYK